MAHRFSRYQNVGVPPFAVFEGWAASTAYFCSTLASCFYSVAPTACNSAAIFTLPDDVLIFFSHPA